MKNRRQLRQSPDFEMDVEGPHIGNDQPRQSAADAAAGKGSSGNVLNARVVYVAAVATMLLITVVCISAIVLYERNSDVTHSVDAWQDDLPAEQRQWFDEGLAELKRALKARLNSRRARNVVLFVGDGMGVSTVTATRIYKYGEEGLLAWERFPNVGVLKVHFSVLKRVRLTHVCRIGRRTAATSK